MSQDEEVQVHPLEVLEQTLSQDASEQEPSAGFAITSPSGFAVVSPSGFAVVSPSGFAMASPSGFAVN